MSSDSKNLIIFDILPIILFVMNYIIPRPILSSIEPACSFLCAFFILLSQIYYFPEI